MSYMKRAFEADHGLPHLEDIEAALDRGEIPNADFDAFDLPSIEDLEGPRCIECGVLSDTRLCTRCYVEDKL